MSIGNGGWDLVQKVAPLARVVLLYGPASVGKTHYAQSLFGKDALQITLNDDISAQELMGFYMPKGNQMEWHNGPFITAPQQGRPLIINEISRGSGAVKDCLLPLLDSEDSMSITLPSGNTIRPALGFKVICTSNDPPESLDPALQARLCLSFEITEPHPMYIAKLEAGLPGMGSLVLDSFKDPSNAINPRAAEQCITLIRLGMDLKDALSACFGKRAADIEMYFKSHLKGA